MSALARAERRMLLAVSQLGLPGGPRDLALRVSAVTYGVLAAELAAAQGIGRHSGAVQSALPHTCENCQGPAIHGEALWSLKRFWCAEHTAWSGHLEHCGDECEALCCGDEGAAP